MGDAPILLGDFRVAPDGSLWLSGRTPSRTAPADAAWPLEYHCAGVARFDGTTWQRYLASHCVRAMEIALDGTIWVLGTPSELPSDLGPDELAVDLLAIPASSWMGDEAAAEE